MTFEKGVKVNEIISEVPQKLRRFIKVRKSKNTKAGRRDTTTELTRAFSSIPSGYSVWYDADAEIIRVDTDTEETASKLRPLVPKKLSDNIEFMVGFLPKKISSTTAVPTNVIAGQWADAGHGVYTRGSTSTLCTLGFGITFENGLNGILTAGHCTEPKVAVSPNGYAFEDTYVEYTEGATNGNYDYAIYRTDGLYSEDYIYFNNHRQTGGFPSTGYFRTGSFIRQRYLWVGMYTCLSGTVSGLDCGEVWEVNYNNRGNAGTFTRLRNYYSSFAEAGDSGAPAFAELSTNKDGEVTAMGIMVGGDSAPYSWSGSPTGLVYQGVMQPIDRIFEHLDGKHNVRVKTTP